MSKEPLIIAIDDDESEVRPLSPDGYEFFPVDPRRDTQVAELGKRLADARLVLVDHKFFDSPPPLSLKASDGASFVSHLRSWAREGAAELAPVILLTNERDAFKNEVPAVGPSLPLGGSFVGREHRLAPTLDVEWIQFKAEPSAKARLASLASAAEAAKKAAGNDGASLSEIISLLNLPEGAKWMGRAHEDIQIARPPINESGATTHQPKGSVAQIVRWLCQRALPYPGFLLSDLYAAWALGLSREKFSALIESDLKSEWVETLRTAAYKGPLENFNGRRWWRVGIDQVVWEIDQQAAKSKGRKDALAQLAPGFDFGELKSPSLYVVAWNEDFTEDEIRPTASCVQLHPPNWPPEALEPWMLVEEVKMDQILRAMCDPNDLS